MGLTVKGCCCASLRTAGMLHGWISIGVLIILIIGVITRLLDYDPDNITSTDLYNSKHRTLDQEIITLVIYLFDIFVSGMLLSGISKNQHKMLLPWLVLRAIGLMCAIPLCVVYLIFAFWTNQAPAIIASVIVSIIICLFVWSWIVIYSLYTEIRDTVVTRTLPMVYQMPTPMAPALPYIESGVIEDPPPRYEKIFK